MTAAVVGASAMAIALPGPATASGFQLKEQSAAGLGTAYAGITARAADSSTAFYNPAGMTRLHGHQLGASASYIMPSSRFSGSATTARGAPVNGGNGGDGAKDAFVPALYGVTALSEDWRLGLAINVPFGMATEYERGWVGRYQALESRLEAVSVMPSVAWRVTDGLSVAAGPVVQYTDVKLTTAVNNLGLSAGDGHQELTGDDFGFGFNLAALWEITPDTRVGVNYRSRIHHTFEGRTDYSNVHPVVAARGGFVDSDASAELTTPDVLRVGVHHDITPAWAVTGEVAWTNWSLFEELRVDAEQGADSVTVENWHDTIFAAIGVIHRPDDAWTLRAGVAYDMSPIPDEHRTARIPGEDRYWIAAGASYHLDDWLSLDIGYTHIFVDDASLDETTGQGRLTGSYENHIDILTAGATLRF